MDLFKGWLRPIIVIFLLAAPAVTQRIASHYLDKPELLPLGLTLEDLAASGEDLGAGPWIKIAVDWGEDYGGQMTRDHLRKTITVPLDHQTDRFFFVFSDVPGDAVGISFIVGPNTYGPYPPGGVARGLNTALAALHMTQAARN